MQIYYFGFFLMSLHVFPDRQLFVALGKAKRAIFFSIFRKVIIVIPLTLVLPGLLGFGTNGVFAAEPISNLIGGTACFCTMLATVMPELNGREKKVEKREV